MDIHLKQHPQWVTGTLAYNEPMQILGLIRA